MFNFLKSKTTGKKLELKIDGMHCSSCSLNIDGELEDLDGVISADTSYAKGTTVVEFDESEVDSSKIIDAINHLGYKVV